MTRLALSNPGKVLQAVYDLDSSEGTWLKEVTRSVAPFIDGGRGALGCLFRLGRELEPEFMHPIRADDELPAAFQFIRASRDEATQAQEKSFQDLGKLIAAGAELPEAPGVMPSSRPSPTGGAGNRRGQLFGEGGLGTLSADRGDAHRIFLREFAHDGIVDAAQIVIPHPASRSFLLFTARQHEQQSVPERSKQRWLDLQSHISAVYDLRQRLHDDDFEATNAIWFDTSGACVESGPIIHSKIRERLREAVLAREAARRADTAAKRVDLQTYWSNIISGKWAILDHFDTDGKRFVIALPVSKYSNMLKGLSSREREVLSHLGNGLSNKAIAYDLMISETAVSSHLGNIYRKLGFDERTTVVRLVQMLRKRGEF